MPRRCVCVSWYYTIPGPQLPTSCESTCAPTSLAHWARATYWIKTAAPSPAAPGEIELRGWRSETQIGPRHAQGYWIGPITVGISYEWCSTHRFLHERADLCLCGRSQLLEREGDRPQAAVVEVRRVAEANRREPALELLRVLEEADDLAVLVIRGHPVPELGREGRRAGFDDRVDPLGHGAIRVRHFGDLREHGACLLLLARDRLPLFDELLHRGSFLVREYRTLLVVRAGALGGLLRGLRWAHGNLLQTSLREGGYSAYG